MSDHAAAVLERKRQQLQAALADVERLRTETAMREAEADRLRIQIEVLEEVEKAEDTAEADRQRRRAPRKGRSGGRGGRRARKITLSNAVREAARHLAPPIATGSVRGYIETHYSALAAKTHVGSISGTMRRMHKDGELELVEKGGPGKEATYKLPQPRPGHRADQTTKVAA